MGRLKASIQAGTMDEISEAEESAKVPATNESYLIDTIETHQEPSAQTTAE
jgi:LPS-assembly lipoprotein